jgi:hypothetical protein
MRVLKTRIEMNCESEITVEGRAAGSGCFIENKNSRPHKRPYDVFPVVSLVVFSDIILSCRFYGSKKRRENAS